MDVMILEAPKHIQMGLQWIFNDDLWRITMTRVTVIIAVGIHEGNDEIIDLIEPALDCLSARECDGHRLPGDIRRFSSWFPGKYCTLEGPDICVLCADTGEVAGHGMAGGAFARSIEVGFAGLRVAYQRINPTSGCGAATDRHAVNERRDARDFFCREIKFWHALIRPSVLDDGRYQLTILIVHHELTADQIGTAFATASIRTMAKTAIRTKNLAAARNHGRVGRSLHRISRRTGHSNGRRARRLGRGWRTCLIGTGSLDRSGNRRLLCRQGSRAKPQ